MRVNLSLLVLAAGALPAQTSLPVAPAAQVVQVSLAGGHYSEPGIAINPNNPRQVLVVLQGGEGVQGTATAAYSLDAGKTFARAKGTDPDGWRVAGDVSATFDNKGRAYLCYLAFDRLGTPSYWAHNVGRNGIFVRRSPDGGKTWDAKAIAVKAFATDHDKDIQFEDEPRIFADNSPTSPHAGSLYVGWVEWRLTQSIILFSHSTDAGQTWSEPLRISTHPGLPRDDNGSLGGFAQAIAPDGTIFAIWADGNSIVLTQSKDGGRSFGKSHPIIEIGPPYFGDIPGVSRVEGFPQIAIDQHDPRGGALYVCWSDYRNGDVDVFVATSSDHGRKWSNPVRANDDPVHNGSDQFYQWMTVDPASGAVYVVFYDRRADPAGRKSRITLARSTDNANTFRNYAWTEDGFDALGAFLGDYTWIAAQDGHVYAAWTETAPPPQAGNAKRGGPETIIRVGSADFSPNAGVRQ